MLITAIPPLYRVEEPLRGGGVAGAEGLEDEGPHPICPGHGRYILRAHSGEYLEEGDPGVDGGAHRERAAPRRWPQDGLRVVFYPDSHLGQRGVVGARKGAEVVGVELGGAVAAHQLVLEEDAHLGDHGVPLFVCRGGYLDGGDEVLAPVGPEHPYGELAAGEDHAFLEVPEHEAEHGGGVGHGVGAVEYDEAVVLLVTLFYEGGEEYPEVGPDVGGVYQRGEGYGVYPVAEFCHLGHFRHYLLEVERLEDSADGIFLHPDGPSRVYYED